METDMQLLQEIKAMSKAIRNGNADSGNAYLMGYIWATLTPEQQQEIADEFAKDFKNVPKRG
jgi:ABC-type transporter MlaC component